jgi:hypothetical protein
LAFNVIENEHRLSVPSSSTTVLPYHAAATFADPIFLSVAGDPLEAIILFIDRLTKAHRGS